MSIQFIWAKGLRPIAFHFMYISGPFLVERSLTISRSCKLKSHIVPRVYLYVVLTIIELHAYTYLYPPVGDCLALTCYQFNRMPVIMLIVMEYIGMLRYLAASVSAPLTKFHNCVFVFFGFFFCMLVTCSPVCWYRAWLVLNRPVIPMIPKL